MFILGGEKDGDDITGSVDALEGTDTSGQDTATQFDDGGTEPAAPATPAPDAPDSAEDQEAAASEKKPEAREDDVTRFKSDNRDIAADIAEARKELAGEDKPAAAGAKSDDAGKPATGDQTAMEVSAKVSGETSPGDVKAAEPYSHWSETAKTTFQAQPEDVRNWMVAREAEFGDALTRGTAIAKDMLEVLAPYQQQMALAGMSPADGLRRLVAAHDLLEKDPRAGLAHLVDLYGIDLQNLNTEAASASLDPEINALRQTVGDLTKTVSSMTQNTQQAHTDNLSAQIVAFRDQVDERGTALHPHFNTVSAHMGMLMENRLAGDMGTAYEMAVYANPVTRASAAASPTLTVPGNGAVSDAVKKAKRAAAGQVDSSSSDSARASTSKKGGNSLADDLRANLREQLDA